MSPRLAYPRPSRNGLGPDAPLLGARFRDWREAGASTRRRQIGIKHHKNSSGLWVPSDFAARTVLAEPNQWPLPWSPRVMVGGSLQTFISDRGGRWLSRVAHRRDLYVATVAVNAMGPVPTVRDGRVFSWPNLFPEGGTLSIKVGTTGYRKVISYPGMPTEMPVVGVAVPAGCSVRVIGRTLVFRNADGLDYMQTKPAHGWWGARTVEDVAGVEGAGVGHVDLTHIGQHVRGGVSYAMIRISPDAETWAGSFGVVHLDPSTDITGTTDTDMTQIIENYTNYNYGSRVTAESQNAAFAFGVQQTLLRTDESLYPSGSYSDCSYDIYYTTVPNTVDSTQSFYRIVSGNAGWVEGTQNHWWENGSCSYGYLAYDTTTPTDWAGGGPGLVSGDDYDATAGLDWAHTSSEEGQYNSQSLPTSWFEDWRDTPSSNGGVYIIESEGVHNDKRSQMSSDDDGTNKPTLTITYTSGGGIPSYHYYAMIGEQ